MNAFLIKWKMYYEIQRMFKQEFSVSKISREMKINRRTVNSYLSMSESDYEQFLIKQNERNKELQPYSEFIKSKLNQFQDTSAAQMHDWLKEKYPDFPRVSPKTVFNFVMWIRQKYNLPKTKPARDYMPIEELPYGQQSQVDFGEYNMRYTNGRRAKVWFFTMSLSRSRYKYIWFTDHPFTTELAIIAHEQAFRFFDGIPDQVVYDQDKLFLVNENYGDLILTNAFRAYTKERSFNLHFCKKADPESKGKIENVVKYVKQNFLYNRSFHDIETLNDEVMGWLGRTGNSMPHGNTKKPPIDEWVIEKPYLSPFTVYIIQEQIKLYTVRKDNAISWKGNLYTLPEGTYKGRGTLARVTMVDQKLIIQDMAGLDLCKHEISSGKGKLIYNTDHRRDKSGAINELLNQVSLLFEKTELALQYLKKIKADKPRYVRDQLILVRQTCQKHNPKHFNEALDYCAQNNLYSAVDFRSVVEQNQRDGAQHRNSDIDLINPLSGVRNNVASIRPNTSKISDYQIIMKS